MPRRNSTLEQNIKNVRAIFKILLRYRVKRVNEIIKTLMLFWECRETPNITNVKTLAVMVYMDSKTILLQ